MIYEELTTPAVIVDLDAVDRNIARKADKLGGVGIAHRPHIKTHKSLYFANKQKAAGAKGITVAKLSEAEVFVGGGFDDILLAYTIVGRDKLARFKALHEKITITTTVDSMHVARGLSQVGVETGKPVRVLIEIDGGLHRGGRQPGQDAAQFAAELSNLPGIHVLGVMGYFGHIYDEPDLGAVRTFANREASLLKETVQAIEEAGVKVEVISAGSTPSSFVAEELQGLTEVRAGNYLFNDVSAVVLGLAKEEDCALRVVCTVVSTPMPGRATFDAGSKTLTSDRAHNRDGFGMVVGRPDAQIIKLNEEHGMLTYDESLGKLQVGDRIQIIPNHACVLPNLTNGLYGVREGKLVETIPVDARGCNF